MASATDLDTVAFIYKNVYTDEAVADLARRDHPLFMDIARQGGFTGTAFFYTVKYSNPQGIAGTITAALASASSSKGLQLQASRKPKFGIITIDGEAIAACDGDQGAFADVVRQETDGKLEEMGDRFAYDLYRDGSGLRGRRASASTNIITLSDSADVRNFKVGMTVIADNAADGLSPNSGTTTVAKVGDDGTITLTSAAAISGFADNDYLFASGDPGTCMQGLALCTPLTTPSSGESFRGVDRSVHPELLAGVRINDTDASIEENIGLAAVKVNQNGKKLERFYVNPINFWQVARRLNAKVEYSSAGGEVGYGFQYIMVHTPAGSVRLVSDADCPTNRGYGCRMDAHYLKHLRGLPHIIMDDGLKSLRASDSDGIEARARGWVNYIQRDPAAFAVIAI